MPLLSRIGSAAARGFGLFVGRVVDPFFEYVTLLLHGDGTNGAQNNTFLDSSTNNFTITRNGNTTQGTFSPYGNNWGTYFNGSSSLSISSSNTALPTGTQDFCVEMWVYWVTQSGSYPQLIANPTTNGFQIYYDVGAGALSVGIFNVANVITYAISQATLNSVWNHIAVTRSGNTFRLFVNGVLQSNGTNTISYAAVTTQYIGSDGSRPYTGYMSNVRTVLGSIPTAYQTSSTTNGTSIFTPSTTPLTAVSGTALLTCQSNRFIDNSSNAFALTVNGSPTIQRFSPFSPSTAYSTSVIGGSGYFDGSDYLNFTDTSNVMDLGGATASFEAWIYPTAATCVIATKYGGVANYNTTNGIEYTIALVSQQFLMYYNVAGTFGTLSDPTTGRALNQWYHIVVASNATTLSLYVNGTRAVTATAGITKPTTRTTVRFGLDSGSTYLTGYLSDVRFIQGTGAYDASQTTITVPTVPVTAVTNTSLLLSYTNAGIYDNAEMNDLETVGNAQVSTSVVKFGSGSMAFDGTGDWLLAPSSVNFNLSSGNWTIESWYYPTTYSVGNNVIVYIGISAADKIVLATIGTNGYLYYLLNGTVVISTTSAATLNAWSHYALVKNGATTTLYLNGTSIGTTTSVPTSSGKSLSLGADSGGAAYFGYMDDLRITKGYARYTANFTVPTAAFPNQ
jgi:hypothetical protein